MSLCNKKIYVTKKDAQTAKNIRHNFSHNNKPLRIYYCNKCKGWHLTKTKLLQENTNILSSEDYS